MADNLIRGYENEEFEAKEQASLEAATAPNLNAATSPTTTSPAAAPTISERVNEDPHPDLAAEPKPVHTSTKINSLVPFVTNGQLMATAIVLAGSFMTFVSLAYPTRVITRLAQVRSRASSQDPWKYLIKMETASNQMWAGSWKRARMIDPSRMEVGLIRRGTGENCHWSLCAMFVSLCISADGPLLLSGISIFEGQSPAIKTRSSPGRQLHLPLRFHKVAKGRSRRARQDVTFAGDGQQVFLCDGKGSALGRSGNQSAAGGRGFRHFVRWAKSEIVWRLHVPCENRPSREIDKQCCPT